MTRPNKAMRLAMIAQQNQEKSSAGRQDMQAMTSPNSFQKCAKDYANAFGFIVAACGNWVELTSTKTGKTQKCYTMQGVQDLCQSAGPNV